MRGHKEIVAFLTKKWEKENGYKLRKDLFAFTDNKIAVQVRFCLLCSCVLGGRKGPFRAPHADGEGCSPRAM